MQQAFSASSSAFQNGEQLNKKYVMKAIGGENTSPPISWKNPPQGTKSFVLINYDKNPVASNWVHWLVANIPSNVDHFDEGASGKIPKPAVELENTFGFQGWGGPQPPKGTGNHEYVFIVYALNVENPSVSGKISYNKLEQLLNGKVLAKATLTGFYEQKK